MEYWAALATNCFFVMISMYLIQAERPDFKNKKNYIYYIISTLLLIFTLEFVSTSYRIIINTMIYIILAYFIFGPEIKKACILGFSMMILNMFAEIIYIIISTPFIEHRLFVNSNSLLVFVQNIAIGIILAITNSIIGKKRIYDKVLLMTDKIKGKQVIIFSLLSVVVFNCFMWFAYFISNDLFNSAALSFIGSAISLFCVVLVYSYLKTSNKYFDISEKYSLSLNNIKEYEEMIEKNRINNHEIRNQFLMLRSISKNKKVISYIDSILDNKIHDNEELLNEVTRIPSGGLRGLIYTKLLLMKDKSIDYGLYVDRRINTRKFNKIDSSCMIDICKSVGVFLDNAIEEVCDLEEKHIVIEIYLDKQDIVISVTNNFIGFIDMENLEKTGYTTKSQGRGYGLSLVNEILSKNDKLENFKELHEDNFTQNLKIKM